MTHTSIELSKKLSEAGFEGESEMMWRKYSLATEARLYTRPPEGMELAVLSGKIEFEYPAYDILNDLCVKYAKEVFGDEKVDEVIQVAEGGNIGDYEVPFGKIMYVTASVSPTFKVLLLLQQGKKQEAEDYIWDNTILNVERV